MKTTQALKRGPSLNLSNRLPSPESNEIKMEKREVEENRELVPDLSLENIIESVLKLSLSDRLVIINIVTDSIREQISGLELPAKQVEEKAERISNDLTYSL